MKIKGKKKDDFLANANGSYYKLNGIDIDIIVHALNSVQHGMRCEERTQFELRSVFRGKPAGVALINERDLTELRLRLKEPDLTIHK